MLDEIAQEQRIMLKKGYWNTPFYVLYCYYLMKIL